MAPTDDGDFGGSLSSHAPPDSIDDSRVIRDVQAFREALERGETPDRQILLAKYPEIAQELSACLDGLELVQGTAPQFQNGGPDSARGTPPDEVFPPHAQLGDYHIVREIGRGGMGVVYEAEQISLSRRVALKVLPFAAVIDPVQIGRFKNEALAAAQLDHPHIVNVHAVGCERGVHYYAMRYVDGRPLSAVIDEHRQSAVAPAEEVAADTAAMAGQSTHVSPDGPAYFRMAAEIVRQVADALDHAHRHGVVHRDVKPSNLLLDGDGKAWVADFGLARMGRDANLTVTGDLVGTLRYMSPEQLRGERAVVDHRTDIYSLGLTLYELLAQRPAFDTTDRQELLRQIAMVDPPPARRWDRAIPVELETIVLKATAKEAAERYATASDLADDLQRYLDDRPVLARRASVLNRTRKWTRRHRTVVRSAAVVVLLGIMMAGGSIGWVVRDGTARRAEADLAVEQALRDAALRRDEGDWPQALVAVQQTERLLARGASDTYRERVRRMTTDLRMVQRLEEIRTSNFDVPHYHFFGVFADKRKDSLYVDAFNAYGIDVSRLDAEAAAERIRESAIRAYLVAALDDWLWTRTYSRKFFHESSAAAAAAQSARYAELRGVADLADPGDVVRRIRNGEGWKNQAELKELARPNVVAGLSPSTAILLSRVLNRSRPTPEGKDVLYAVAERSPDDFLLNVELAQLLSWEAHVSGAGAEEAVGFMRAAVARRPDEPGLRIALGRMLRDAGHIDQAAATFQRVMELHPERRETVARELSDMLVTVGRFEEAARAYNVSLGAAPVSSSPGVAYRIVETHALRARCYEQLSQWDNAIADWRAAAAQLSLSIDADPTNYWAWPRAAVLQLYVDDREDYRSTRDSMLQRFGGTDDSTRAAEMAVVCLIAPDAADLPDRVAGLIVPWLELPGENTLMAWTELAQGMAEYRRENFAASMDWLRRSRVTGKSQVAAFHAIAEFFLAMAEHRGSRPGEAQERLDEGERLLESAFRESKRAALGPFNVLMCAVVHREAEALVRGRADDETARYVRSTVVPPVAVNPANDSRPESALPQGSREGAPVVPEHEE